MNKSIVISLRTIIISLGIIALLFLLFQIRDVIVQLLVALIIALAIEPGVKFFVKKGFPRSISVGLVFGTTVLFLGVFITLALPVVVNQTRSFLFNLPALLASVVKSGELMNSIVTSIPQLTVRTSEGVFNTTISIFSNAFNILTVFIFSLYLSLDLLNVKSRFVGLFSEDLKDYAEEAWITTEINLSRWMAGQATLMLAVGFTSYVALVLLGIPYAVPLAILAGLLEIVPILGPIISTIIAGIVGFSISPLMGCIVVAVFIGIQQLENGFLVPRIMQKIIGFNPLVTMAALLIGAKLLGVTGALIAIPVALILIVILHTLISIDFEN